MLRIVCIPLLLVAVVAGCSAQKKPTTITLATTTSTRDTGLLDHLVPLFREQTGIEVKVVAVGSGQALELGRRGDADVLLTHAPSAEQEFMDAGFGSERRAVMYNDFVLIGPASDPAGLQGKNAVEAMQLLSQGSAAFVSRGDESGTHKKEQQLWKLAKLTPQGDWYIEAGSGMAETLRMADQKQAYTLTDRGTFLTQKENLQLVVLVEEDPPLENHYSVIVVNRDKHPGLNSEGAQRFADFLVAPQTQSQIADFGKDKFGQALFHPEATSTQK